MSQQQPEAFASYPRENAYGSVDRLQALCDGYFGLNAIFFVNILMAIATRSITMGDRANDAGLLVAIFAGIGLTVAILTFPFNRKIGYGIGWNPIYAVVASVLMGINSALFCGIVGYIVMQMLASREMKKYGVEGSPFGLKKKYVQARIERMKQVSSEAI